MSIESSRGQPRTPKKHTTDKIYERNDWEAKSGVGRTIATGLTPCGRKDSGGRSTLLKIACVLPGCLNEIAFVVDRGDDRIDGIAYGHGGECHPVCSGHARINGVLVRCKF